MAILCLATSLTDLKERLGRIVIGYKSDKVTPVYARDLNAHGAMAALLKDAIKPNLVQTLENNLAIIHGGPFANIAHGCNTVTATQTALKLADYVVTEAGFGADLGAEKFIDIKCRMSGLKPSAVVLVATIRALKFHGGVAKDALNTENLTALEKGFANLEKHLTNITQHYGLPCVVAINHFSFDTDAECALLKAKCEALGVICVLSRHWADGGKGAEALANAVLDSMQNRVPGCTYVYPDELSLWDKIVAIATKLYGAAEVSASPKVKAQLKAWDADYGSFPICIAKTQMSFSTNPELKGAPTGHTLEIRDVRLANGAGFIVAIAGDIMTMPGLPKVPAAERIDINESGKITGLF
jgi:formate--tetrahydrofolate ligase